MAGCRSCGAHIRWVKTERDKRIPLDREPTPDGNIVPVLVDEEWRARVLSQSQADEYRRLGGDTYTAHFSTCPQADAWRQARNNQLKEEHTPDE